MFKEFKHFRQKLRPLKNASRYSGINHPDEIGTGIHTLSILRIALKVSATLHSVSLRAKFEPNVPQ
jgi:hypothetical protein